MNIFRLKSQRGGVGSEWWGEEFIDLMEEVGDVGRLSRGRSYARQGQIRSFIFTEDGIEATIMGSQTYRVTITFPQYTSEEKKIILDWLKSQPVWMSCLFAGKLLEEFADTVREKSGVDIIPEYEQMMVQCTCPDYGEPCKHAASAYYYLGECIDNDPFLFFSLRGLTKENILREFRKTRLKNRGDGDNITSDKKDILKTYYEIQFPLEKFAPSLPEGPKKSATHILEWGKTEVKLQRRDIILWLADIYPSTSSFSRSIMSQLATELSKSSPKEDIEE
ncbi:MAG: SWIM zinc finger family protein [Methanomicrobiales archaeon]|jgi:uncharacterized Zn finger protein|nr:SWIM zinc finger family protein [Methanomicrobiales archaeon]